MAEASWSNPEDMHTLVLVFGAIFASKGYPFKNMFNILNVLSQISLKIAMHYQVILF